VVGRIGGDNVFSLFFQLIFFQKYPYQPVYACTSCLRSDVLVVEYKKNVFVFFLSLFIQGGTSDTKNQQKKCYDIESIATRVINERP